MNKFLKGIVAMGLVGMPAMAEIKISDQLTVSGFVDMSATYADDSSGTEGMGGSLDQAEFDFMFKFSDKVSAQVDLEGSSDFGVQNAFVEQGFITVSPVSGFSVTAGRFLSSSGFESEEPTGLFQYSVSKNLGADKLYGHYQNGVAAKFSQPMFSVYGSVVTDVWTFNGTNTNLEYPGFEAQLAVMPIEGLTAKAHYLIQTYSENDVSEPVARNGDPQSLINAWIMYAAGMITVAGEFNMMLDWDAAGSPDAIDNGMGWLGMVNANFGKPAVTVRFSGVNWDGASDPDMEITLAPSVVITDNLALIAEYKRNINAESNEAALEALLTF